MLIDLTPGDREPHLYPQEFPASLAVQFPYGEVEHDTADAYENKQK